MLGGIVQGEWSVLILITVHWYMSLQLDHALANSAVKCIHVHVQHMHEHS